MAHATSLGRTVAAGGICGQWLCVPKTSSTSCDQAVFVDQASGMSGPSDAVPVEIDRFGEGFQRRAASRERCGRC